MNVLYVWMPVELLNSFFLRLIESLFKWRPRWGALWQCLRNYRVITIANCCHDCKSITDWWTSSLQLSPDETNSLTEDSRNGRNIIRNEMAARKQAKIDLKWLVTVFINWYHCFRIEQEIIIIHYLIFK